MAEWFESFFDALAHDVWRALVPDEHSDAEAQFVADALDAGGFDVVDLFGGISGAPFVVGAPTLIVVATRR